MHRWGILLAASNEGMRDDCTKTSVLQYTNPPCQHLALVVQLTWKNCLLENQICLKNRSSVLPECLPYWWRIEARKYLCQYDVTCVPLKCTLRSKFGISSIHYFIINFNLSYSQNESKSALCLLNIHTFTRAHNARLIVFDLPSSLSFSILLATKHSYIFCKSGLPAFPPSAVSSR